MKFFDHLIMIYRSFKGKGTFESDLRLIRNLQLINRVALLVFILTLLFLFARLMLDMR